MKRALIAVLALATLAFPAFAFAAAKAPTHQMLGVVPPFVLTPGTGPAHGKIIRHHHSPRPTSGKGFSDINGFPNSDDNLTFGGADQIPPASLKTLPRTMHSSTVYAIYWVPPGYKTASNYRDVVDGYFQNLADASFGFGTPNSSDAQYGDATGGIQNDVTFGGSAVDTFSYPKSGGCAATQPSSVLGTTVCLSDTQIETEVKRFADSQHWDHGPNVEFFLYTAHNVGSCFYDDKHVPVTGQVCAYDYYCAYHSEFGTSPKTEYIYANMPWPNQGWQNPANGNQYKSVCDAGEHPNGTGSESNGTDPDTPTPLDAADEVINVSSHEHNESITDPVGYGWWNDNPLSDYAGYENGDQCAWYWSNDSVAGVSDNNSFYTNQIGEGQYFIQGEWSNADATDVGYSGCVWGYDFSPMQQSDASLTPADPVVGQTLVANVGTWLNYPMFSYDWVRCPSFFATPGLTLTAVKSGMTPCTDLKFTDSTLSNTDSYKPTAADARQQIMVFYTAYNAGDYTGGNIGPVTVGGEPEVTGEDGSAPSISYPGETLTPGTTVTGNLGLWTNSPSKYTVQWQHCLPDNPDSCTTFKTVSVTANKKAAQTTTTLKLATSDTSFALNMIVTASNAVGAGYPASSGLTIPVTGGPENTAGPTWTDDPATIGSADAINLGTWTGETSGFTVTVNRCDAPDDISTCELAQTLTAPHAATSVNYTPTAADANLYLQAIVVAKNASGNSQPASVMSEGVVGGVPTVDPEAGPTVTVGSVTEGDDVSGDFGTWLNSPTQFRYKWYSCSDSSDTSTCSLIGVFRAAAGPVTYTTTASDDGHYIRLFVEAINANGFSVGVWSSNATLVNAIT